MARVRGETFAQKFGGATNLQVFREPSRRALPARAARLRRPRSRRRWRERACGSSAGRGPRPSRRSPCRAPGRPRRGFVPRAHVGLDQLAQGDLEDLQLVFEDQGEQPLVGTRVDVELDGEVRERAALCPEVTWPPRGARRRRAGCAPCPWRGPARGPRPFPRPRRRPAPGPRRPPARR